MDISKLEQETLKLDLDQRAQLAEKLLLSLVDSYSEAADMKMWIAESHRRLKELRDDTAEEVPVEQVVESMYAALK